MSVDNLFSLLQVELIQYVGIAAFGVLVLLVLVPKIWYRVFPLPLNEFNFRGVPVYTDRGQKSHVFVSRKLQLSAKPDFVFKVGANRYAIVEYKSAKRPMSEMDRIQVIVSVIAARSRYNVRGAYVVTSKGIYPVKEASLSTSRLYKKIKRHHRIAKRIKHKNYKPKNATNGDCTKCSRKRSCDRAKL
ncbi:hypothetical protein [Vibrio mediterranei]|uniref:hypothetical protein n=1 Tax=Vibrio mediterranei TaxID=689 RepID=UPI004067D36C